MKLCQILSALLSLTLAIGARVNQAQQHPYRDHHNHQAFTATKPAHQLEGNSCGGYLLAESTDTSLNHSNPRDALLSDILDRQGPDRRPMRDFRDFSDISVDVAQRAWQLMHHHAQTAMSDRLQALGPLVVEALVSANVSTACFSAAQETIVAAKRLESWAVQLLSSWGNFPPTGIFEGTYSDIGSYYGCINVPENRATGHAHYCTISYQPVLPTRHNYELIINKEPIDLLNSFVTGNKSEQVDAFTEILEYAQYSHYVYYKFGTCFPIACSPRDVQRLARLLGRRNILMSGPVKCHSKYPEDYKQISSSDLVISTRDLNNGVYIWKPHTTQTQWVALIIVGLISCLIVALTLVDVALNRLPQLIKYHYLRLSQDRRRLVSRSGNHSYRDKNAIPLNGAATCLEEDLEEANGEKEEAAAAVVELDANNNSNKRNNNNNSGMLASGAEAFELEAGEANEEAEEEKHPLKVQMKLVAGSGRPAAAAPVVLANHQQEGRPQHPLEHGVAEQRKSAFMRLVDDCSIVTNACQFFQVSQSQLKNDILCINGIRCITMSWIIITHTMQYNDWSAFARTREIETHFKSLINQPLFNGSYLVDTFFLVSGLLTSFSSFKRYSNPPSSSQETSTQGRNSYRLLEKFSSRSYLIGRYLRLTPQVLFVSLLFILLPLLSSSGGPHWYTMTGEYSENCAQNWWVNLLYLQAFYRSDKMCNFVCWWISVDMFYHLFALALILLIYHHSRRRTRGGGGGANNSSTSNGQRRLREEEEAEAEKREGVSVSRLAAIGCGAICLGHALPQAYKHYQLELPPNLLSTIPQTGAMWSHMTLELFWTPWAHAFPFFLGFYLGYLMAQHQARLAAWFTWRRSLVGWTLSTAILLCQSYSTYFWVIGRWRYTRLVATLFHLVCPITWSTCLAWIILACHHGYGTFVNRLLSCKLFIILGKASYIVYLSHFLVLFTFFGSQNLLLEPTQLMMSYVIVGNICLSMLLGCLLSICFEMPWLKGQRRLMRYVR